MFYRSLERLTSFGSAIMMGSHADGEATAALHVASGERSPTKKEPPECIRRLFFLHERPAKVLVRLARRGGRLLGGQQNVVLRGDDDDRLLLDKSELTAGLCECLAGVPDL